MGSVRYKVEDDIVKEIHKVVVHRIRMGDVDDPDLYVAQPIWEWQQTEQGKFIMENAVEQPEWHRHVDMMNYGHQYAIVAELEQKKLAEFYLKWGKQDGNNS